VRLVFVSCLHRQRLTVVSGVCRTTGLLTITESQFNNLQSLFFNIGGTSYELTANAQIWPRAYNSTIGGESGRIYLVVSDLGSNSGQGLDFISASSCRVFLGCV